MTINHLIGDLQITASANASDWLWKTSLSVLFWRLLCSNTWCVHLCAVWMKCLLVCQCLRILHIYLREECSWDGYCIIRKGSYVRCGLIFNGTHECRVCVNIFVSGMRTVAQCYSRWVVVGSACTLLHVHFLCSNITFSLHLQHRTPSNWDLKIATISLKRKRRFLSYYQLTPPQN